MTLARPAGAVVALGHEHTASGAATITLIGSNFANRKLECNNLGSSGLDGVSVNLPNSAGFVVRFTACDVAPTQSLVHRDMAARGLVSGAMTTLVVASATQVASDLEVSATCPGVQTCRIEIWNGANCVYSQTHPSGTVVTMDNTALDAPGSELSVCARSKRCPDCPPGHVTLIKREIPTGVTVGPVTLDGTSVMISFDTPTDPPPYKVGAIRWTSTGSGGGGGGVAISGEGDPVTPPRGKPIAEAAVVSVISGANLQGAAAAGEMSFTPDGTGDPMAIRLNGLPPGEPYYGKLMRTAAVSISPDYMTGTGPSTITMECVTTYDDGAGGPPFDATDGLTWAKSTSDGTYTITITRSAADVSGIVLLISGDQRVGLSPHPPFTMSCDHPPASARTLFMDGIPMMCVGFPAGTSATLDGSSTPCDSAVFTLPVPSQWNRRISDVRIVHPPGTPPGTWRAMQVVGASHVADGVGMDVDATGPEFSLSSIAITTSPTGERRLPVSNLGSSGQDGVEVTLRGSRSLELAMPPAGSSTENLASMTMSSYTDPYPCAGLPENCPPTCAMTLSGLYGTSSSPQMGVTYSTPNSQLWLEENGRYHLVLEADTDGDGQANLSPTTPAGVVPSSIQMRQITPRLESHSVRFASPVHITIRGSSFSTNEVTLWRVSPGGAGGTDSPPTGVVRLNGLPPGTPVIGTLEVAPPRVQTAGAQVGTPGLTSTFNGHPIVPTWVQVEGPLRMLDLERDGMPDLVVANAHSLSPDWSYGGSLTGDLRSASPLGVMFTCDMESRRAKATPTILQVQLEASRPGQVQVEVWDVTMGTGGGSSTIKSSSVDLGSNTNWDFQGGGQLQASYSGEGPISFTNPPSTLEFIGDVDGDGIPDLRCSGFAPGTQCTVSGVPHPCDEVIMHATGQSPVSRLERITVLPTGIQCLDGGLADVRIAEFAVAPPSASVFPTGIPRVALAISTPVPNPSFSSTSLRFAIARAGRVKATVLDVSGRVVATLADRGFEAGEHALTWAGATRGGRQAAAGIYFVRVEHEGADAQTVRLTHLR